MKSKRSHVDEVLDFNHDSKKIYILTCYRLIMAFNPLNEDTFYCKL